MFFEGFMLAEIPTPEGPIRLRHGGSGPPLLLLHGNPQTHVSWHRVAPLLARHFEMVCPDLRGYGGSFKPPARADHAPYSKRAMAGDAVAVMRHFGHRRFLVAGHDRGARVGHRLALDHPQAVERLAVLDIVPTIENFERADTARALAYYHWFWFAQPHPIPEMVISAASEVWFRAHTSRGKSPDAVFAPEALADYLAAARNPDMVRGMCEDYRAAVGIDLEHDRASRAAGLKVACPLLVLWGEKGKVGRFDDPLALWGQYASGRVEGGPVDTTHYLAEEDPEAIADWFLRFFR
ncbi:MAG: alpha/beta hydrolase [Rhodospirillales bacterium]|nr:alpha/beta hydrolase [Rhodospirillales bacterium]